MQNQNTPYKMSDDFPGTFYIYYYTIPKKESSARTKEHWNLIQQGLEENAC